MLKCMLKKINEIDNVIPLRDHSIALKCNFSCNPVIYNLIYLW